MQLWRTLFLWFGFCISCYEHHVGLYSKCWCSEVYDQYCFARSSMVSIRHCFRHLEICHQLWWISIHNNCIFHLMIWFTHKLGLLITSHSTCIIISLYRTTHVKPRDIYQLFNFPPNTTNQSTIKMSAAALMSILCILSIIMMVDSCAKGMYDVHTAHGFPSQDGKDKDGDGNGRPSKPVPPHPFK